jgi:hypothetical protein
MAATDPDPERLLINVVDYLQVPVWSAPPPRARPPLVRACACARASPSARASLGVFFFVLRVLAIRCCFADAR